jgi:hypothetical protein
MNRARRTILLALALVTIGCAARTQSAAPSHYLLIANPDAGSGTGEPAYIWVEDDKIPFSFKGMFSQRAVIASPEIVAQYGSPTGGGKISARQGVPYGVPYGVQQGASSEHESWMTVTSPLPPERLRADAVECDTAVRKEHIVSVRYVEQLRLADLPWKHDWTLFADDRIVPMWAQVLDLALVPPLIGVAVLGGGAGAALGIGAFSKATQRVPGAETLRPLEAFKACMESRGHSVEVHTTRPIRDEKQVTPLPMILR